MSTLSRLCRLLLKSIPSPSDSESTTVIFVPPFEFSEVYKEKNAFLKAEIPSILHKQFNINFPYLQAQKTLKYLCKLTITGLKIFIYKFYIDILKALWYYIINNYAFYFLKGGFL
jgi:hypothetical protein